MPPCGCQRVENGLGGQGLPGLFLFSRRALAPHLEAVKKSRVARLASATTSDARRADESMRGHRGGGATKQMASSRRKTGRSGFFHSLLEQPLTLRGFFPPRRFRYARRRKKELNLAIPSQVVHHCCAVCRSRRRGANRSRDIVQGDEVAARRPISRRPVGSRHRHSG